MIKDLTLDKNGIWIDKEFKRVSYPVEGNKFSFQVEEKSFWFKQRNQIIKAIIDRFPFKDNYADIGGGNGYQAKFIADSFNAEAFLIEPGYEGCLNAKKRGLNNVYNIQFQNFDFMENNISAVGLYDVIEHIENAADFLKDLKKCLPGDSLIYITVPAYQFLWSDVDVHSGHYRRYTLSSLNVLAEKAGLEKLYASYFFTYIPFITFFLRTIPYKLRKKKQKNILSAAREQLTPSPLAVNLFNFLHRLELPFIKNKSLPFGGSCIAVYKT